MPMNKKIIIVFFLLGFVLLIIPAVLKPWQFPSDDSFFYLQVAHNIVAGHGSTFNNITTTNGYHPLWMGICIALAFIADNDKLILLHLVIIFQAILTLLISYIFYKISNKLSIRNFCVSIPILAGYFLSIGNYGSEAHINGLMHFIAILFIIKNESLNIKTSLLLGLVLALIFLARLDNVFFIAMILLYYGFINVNKKANLKYIIVAGFVGIIMVLPYFLFNYINWGHIVPISGAIKSIFPKMTFDLNSLGVFGQVVTFAVLVCYLMLFKLKLKSETKNLLLILSLSSLISSLYVVIFTDHHTNWAWYYVSGVITILFFLPLILDKIESKLSLGIKFQFVTFVIALILMIFSISRSWSEYFNPEARGFNPFQFKSINNCRWSISVGKWLKENLPADSRILIYEWPGMIAYFSDMKIVPIDGLMNDFAFQNDLIKYGIEEYIKLKNLEYFIAPYELFSQKLMGYENYFRSDGKLEFRLYSSLYRKNVGSICVDDLELIVKFDEVIQCDGIPKIAMWKFRKDRN